MEHIALNCKCLKFHITAITYDFNANSAAKLL